MHNDFPAVTTTDAVDDLFERSKQAPVLVFKHDPYCPISAAAYRAMKKVQGDIALVDVAHDKDVASAVTKRTGVQHESPQVIVLKDGRATWSASLWDITTDAVSTAATA